MIMINFKKLGEECVFTLENINRLTKNDPNGFIADVENLFKDKIDSTVDYILSGRKGCKILMMAGPSSSGKTTTANMIKSTLEARGVPCAQVSLDDFYTGITKAPLLSDGSRDFESIRRLDVDEIKRCLLSLINNGFCDMPTYNFALMAPNIQKKRVEIPDNGMMIVEGIHALNPEITEALPSASILKLYVSVVCEINNGTNGSISSRGIRLMRRTVRDYNYRHFLPIRTVLMWKNVCRGEDLYISPFKSTAEIHINSTHAYEPCVMAKKAIALFESIPPGNDVLAPEYKRLYDGLSRFVQIDPALVPKNSLLREFI